MIRGPPVGSWPGEGGGGQGREGREKCQKEEEENRHTHHKCKDLWMSRIMKQLPVDSTFIRRYETLQRSQRSPLFHDQ